MMKRVLSLVLCLVTVLLTFTACSHGEDDKGAYIRMFLSEPIYDLDPLEAFDNADTLQIVSMLFEGLFYADDEGKVHKGLVDDYKFYEDKDQGRYFLNLTLNVTHWSDGVQMNANHVQFAFRRLFYSDVSHPAVALLYDVKNARGIAKGDISVDKLGVTVVDNMTVEIEFEHEVNEDEFLRNLCSPALAPLRDDIVEFNADWAKKSSTIVCSGPFMVRSMKYNTKDGFILERNSYYYRDRAKDDLDKYVTPYRIVADFTTDIVEQLKLYNKKKEGGLYYIGAIPFAARSNADVKKIVRKADGDDNASTHVYYLNQKANIGGTQLFANAAVRNALSLALDRDAIAKALIFAEEADGLVPNKVFNRTDREKEFRKKVGKYIDDDPDIEEAQALLSGAGINASTYSFTITVAAYDTDHVAVAEMAKAAWEALGFKVTVKALEVKETKDADGNLTGIYENPYKTALKTGDFEVIALDLVATSIDAFGYLAPFATAFSGNAMEMDTTINPNYELSPHITGYNKAEYNELIESAYAEKSERKRAKLLHKAEEMLMEDMPVIPVVYNQTVSLASGKLSKIESNFFCNAIFTETKLSGYWKIAIINGFVENEDDAPADAEAAD